MAVLFQLSLKVRIVNLLEGKTLSKLDYQIQLLLSQNEWTQLQTFKIKEYFTRSLLHQRTITITI